MVVVVVVVVVENVVDNEHIAGVDLVNVHFDTCSI